MKSVVFNDGVERLLKTKEDLKDYLYSILDETKEFFYITIYNNNQNDTHIIEHSFLNVSKSKENIINEIYEFIHYAVKDNGFEVFLVKDNPEFTTEIFHGVAPQCLYEFKIVNIIQDDLKKI